MTFKEKIDIILRHNKLGINTPSGLENYLKVSVGSISKYYRKNEEPGSGILKKIQTGLSVSDIWWTSGKGDIFVGDPQNQTNNSMDDHHKGDSIRILREVLEEGTDYRIIPKTVLEGEYRIMPKKELDKYEKQFDKIDERTQVALKAKDEVIAMKDDLIKAKESEILRLQEQLRTFNQKAS